MNPSDHIHRLVRFTRLRLFVNRVLDHLSLACLVAGGVALVLVLLDRMLALTLPLSMIYIGLGCGAFGLAIVASILTREPPMQAAVLIDERVGLSERVSSVLALERQHLDSEWAQAMLADTQRAVQDIRPRQTAPFQMPRSLGWLAMVLAVFAGVYFWLPQMDLLGKLAAQEEVNRRQQELAQAKEQLRQQMAEIQKHIPDKDILKNIDPLADPQAEIKLNNPEKLRAETVKRMDQLQDKLKNALDTDKFKALEGLKAMLAQLKPEPKTTNPSANKLTQALKDGDFNQAKAALQEMEESLAREREQGKNDQAKDTSAQLEKLSRELSELAKRQDIQQALKNSGLKPEEIQHALDTLAKRDLNQLAEDLKKSGLSPERIAQLMEKVKQQLGGEEKLKKLADQLQKAAQQCQGGKSGQKQPGQPGEAGDESAMNDLEQELSDAEAVNQQLNEIEAAINQAKQAQQMAGNKDGQGEGPGGEGELEFDPQTGEWRAGDPSRMGRGQGGPGMGRGGGNPQKETPFGTEKVKNKTEQTAGTIIKRWSEDGAQIKGEAKAEFTNVSQAAQREAAEAVNKDQVPRQYQNAVKGYFGGLNEEKPKNTP